MPAGTHSRLRIVVIRSQLPHRHNHNGSAKLAYGFVLIAGLLAGMISGIVGTGSAIILIPVLAYAFGPKEAVPIMAVAAIMANLSRVLAWWHETDWRAFAAYSISGIPAAALGAMTLLALPARAIDIAIGVFIIAMIPVRRWMTAQNYKVTLVHLAIAGALIGYLTGIVVSTGPLNLPFFLSYGLVKGAFLATEAASSLSLYISKAITFRSFGALPFDIAGKGLIAGSAIMAGTFISKRAVARLDADSFRFILDGMMLICGLSMLWNAFITPA